MGAHYAIGYLRVSTEEQSTHGVSLEAQAAKIRAWCLANDATLVAVYRDEGISGHKGRDARPGLQAALQHACRLHGSLVFYSLSRFARNTKETLALAEYLNAQQADLVSLSEKLDTTSAAGKVLFRILAALAEFERDQVIERTKMAMAYKRAKGQRISRHLPYGYQLAPDGIAVVPEDAEQLIVTAARRYAQAGLGLREIARRLAQEGHLSRTGSPFQPKTIKAMLRDTA
jgi:DNA invertase Pin-like site-specific DNA recombinase